MRLINATIIAALLLLSPASAQQRTVYGPDGRVSARTITDSQGATTIYDAQGRVTGRTSTDSSGTVTLYGADGRRAGSISTARPAARKSERP